MGAGTLTLPCVESWGQPVLLFLAHKLRMPEAGEARVALAAAQHAKSEVGTAAERLMWPRLFGAAAAGRQGGGEAGRVLPLLQPCVDSVCFDAGAGDGLVVASSCCLAQGQRFLLTAQASKGEEQLANSK